MTTGKIVSGHIVLEGEPLPDGADVTVLVQEADEPFEITPELRAALLESIAQCDRGETISADELLREMRSRE
jgi:hypothetical protein